MLTYIAILGEQMSVSLTNVMCFTSDYTIQQNRYSNNKKEVACRHQVNMYVLSIKLCQILGVRITILIVTREQKVCGCLPVSLY